MVADPVTTAKILVGGIVKHTPTDAAGMLTIGNSVILHPTMAQGMLLPLLPGVKGLCWEHVTVVFCDQQRLVHIGCHGLFRFHAGIAARVRKIIVAIHILKQVALLNKADTAGGAAGIQFVSQRVGALIQFIAVLTFIDADTPEDDRRMIAILQHHFAGIFHALFLPAVILADMLPSGNFGKYQKTQSIAFVNKILTLGIMGSAHNHAAQFLLQNAGIFSLQAFRCGIAHVRPALMAVQTPQKYRLAVEEKSILFELRCAEAKLHLLHIKSLSIADHAHAADMAIGIITIPAARTGHLQIQNGIHRFLFQKRLTLLCKNFNNKLTVLPVFRGDFQMDGFCCGGAHIQIGNQTLISHIQPHFPIQSAIGQIVDHKSEGRYGRVFSGVQLHRNQIFTALHAVCDFHAKCRIAASVRGQFPAVDIDCGNMRRTVKLQKQPLAQHLLRHFQRFAISANHLIAVVVSIVQRQFLHRMGQAHSFSRTCTAGKILVPVSDKFPSIAKADHRNTPFFYTYHTAHRQKFQEQRCRRCKFSSCNLCKSVLYL